MWGRDCLENIVMKSCLSSVWFILPVFSNCFYVCYHWGTAKSCVSWSPVAKGLSVTFLCPLLALAVSVSVITVACSVDLCVPAMGHGLETS